MSRADLEKLTVPKLRALAKEVGVSVPAHAAKDELVDLLVRVRGAQASRIAAATAPTGGKKAAGRASASKAKAEPRERAPAAGEVAPERPATRTAAVVGGEPETPGIVAPTRLHEPGAALAAEYGEDRVALLARDPRWAFAYWEISDQRLRDAFAHAGRDPSLVLRVYELTGEAGGMGRYRDWPAGARIGRLYLELDAPGRSFIAEIGARAIDGTFVPAARSDAAQLPPDRPSTQIDHSFRPAGPIAGPAAGLGTSPGLGGESGCAVAGAGPSSPGLPTSGGLPSSPGGSSPRGSPSSPDLPTSPGSWPGSSGWSPGGAGSGTSPGGGLPPRRS